MTPKRNVCCVSVDPRVVFEGDGLLLVDKPAGLPTHRTSDPRRPNLFDLLRERYPTISLLHRLDADTSGLLLFTLDREWNPLLAKLFESNGIDKTYLAVIRDARDLRRSWTVKSNIIRAERKRNVYRSLLPGESCATDKTALPAETRFRLLERKSGLALIEAHPITGRPHQIRVHLAEEGMPIVGDRIYGGPGGMADRMLLHAWSLAFVDPRSKRRRFFRTEPPAGFPPFAFFARRFS